MRTENRQRICEWDLVTCASSHEERRTEHAERITCCLGYGGEGGGVEEESMITFLGQVRERPLVLIFFFKQKQKEHKIIIMVEKREHHFGFGETVQKAWTERLPAQAHTSHTGPKATLYPKLKDLRITPTGTQLPDS